MAMASEAATVLQIIKYQISNFQVTQSDKQAKEKKMYKYESIENSNQNVFECRGIFGANKQNE